MAIGVRPALLASVAQIGEPRATVIRAKRIALRNSATVTGHRPGRVAFLRVSSQLLVLLGVGLITSLWLPSVAGAADATPEVASAAPFLDQIDVDLVTLQVVVRDGDDPVTGLEIDDFVVEEDGRRVNLLAAEEVKLVAGEVPEQAGDPNTGVPALRVSETAATRPLLLVLFVDRASLSPNSAKTFEPAVLAVIDELIGPKTAGKNRVMVAAFERDLSLPGLPTADPAVAKAAVLEVLKGSTTAMQRFSQREQLLRDLDQRGGGQAAIGSLSPVSGEEDPTTSVDWARDILRDIESYGAEHETAARRTVAALAQVFGDLAGVPARPVVLYVGGGLHANPAEALLDGWREAFPDRVGDASLGVPSIAGQASTAIGVMAELEAAATAAGITFVALTNRHATEGTAAIGGAVARTVLAGDGLARRQSLEDLARETGGTVVFGAEVENVVPKIVAELGNYYELAWAAATPPDGKRRKIKVEVDRAATGGKRVSVRHRSERVARPAEERMREETRAALLVDLDNNPLGASIVLGKINIEDQRMAVELALHFPLGKLVLLPRGEVHEGRLSIYMAASDADGRRSPITRQDLPLRIPNDRLLAALGQSAVWQTSITLRNAPHDLVIGLRDEIGGTAATVRTRIDPSATRP